MHTHTLKIVAIVAALPILLAGCFKTKAQIAKEQKQIEMQQTLNKNVANQEENLEQTQAKVGRIQGKIEELEFFRKKELEENRRTLTNYSERISMLEEKVSSMEKNQADFLKEMKKLQQDNLRMLQKGSRRSRSRGTSNSFKKGVQAFESKKYAEAASHFEAFAKRYPESKSFLRANFLLGQSHFNQKKYMDAIVAYSVVYEKNGKDSIWRRSTLNIARSFYRLGKKSDGKPFAQALVKRFPNSDEGKRAKKLLE